MDNAAKLRRIAHTRRMAHRRAIRRYNLWRNTSRRDKPLRDYRLMLADEAHQLWRVLREL